MEYEFMRRLTKGLPEELVQQVLTALTEQEIEVYAVRCRDNDDCNEDCEAGNDQKASYVIVSPTEEFPGGDIYIPAADRDRAIELLQQTEAAGYICEDPVESLQMTETQKWEADMVRRHRRNKVICLVVIVLAAVYYAIRGFV